MTELGTWEWRGWERGNDGNRLFQQCKDYNFFTVSTVLFST